ncbi:MAG TPA: class I SAM-dependent methyltransferase [Burkholderiales bacterium]|nr:class I SAM-dependent methyltransferase [Burkholderiales bacterium]
MTPQQVAASYDELADRWNSDDFPRSNGIGQHERALAFAGIGRRALDVGCGSSGRIIDLLQSRGYAVEGLDLSARMLALARARHPDVTFHHADICEWVPPHPYDFISAWDSIWHVPLSQQEAVLAKLLQGLAPGGVCIFTTGGLDARAEKTDSAMGPPMYYSVLGVPRTLEAITRVGCLCRHLEYDQHPEKHLCVIAQKI